tara:strand:+ start:381 stop:593 length:213 start_codon:yes stop_codon:yes gene_type:complete
MNKKELENLIKENFKDTALRIHELDNKDRNSLLAEYKEWILNELDFDEIMMLPYEAYTNKSDKNYLDDLD